MEQAQEGAVLEQAQEGAGEEQALGLGSKPSPHNPLTSPGVPGGALVTRNWTEPAEMKMSWAGLAEMMSWAGPAETKMSWTGLAEMMSWAGPAETPAGLRVPRTVEGLSRPRTAADLPRTAG